MAKKRSSGGKKSGVVGEPPSPAMLTRIGAMSTLPAAQPDYRPEGAWVQTWRIVGCHGYDAETDGTVGMLRLERRAPAGGRFELRVEQRIIHDDGTLHEQQAVVLCLDDALASLVEWKLSSRHSPLGGTPWPELTAEEAGSVKNGAVEIRKGKAVNRIQAAGAVTSEWSLFAAVPRMAKDKALAFDMLEGLSLYRPGHRLDYHGPYEWREPLEWFQQAGHGTLPYDYWVDRHGRLAVAAMLAHAWVLDENVDKALAERRAQVERRVKGKGGDRDDG